MVVLCRYRFMAVGLLLAGFAHAADVPLPDRAKSAAAEHGSAPSNLRIWQDPVSGEWSDQPITDDQKRAASQAAAVDFSKIRTIQHADGSIEYRMNGQMVDNVVARRGEDGKLQITCSEHGLEHDHATTRTALPANGGRDVR